MTKSEKTKQCDFEKAIFNTFPRFPGAHYPVLETCFPSEFDLLKMKF